MSKSTNQEYTLLRKEYPRTWRIWFRMNRRCELGQDGNYVDVEVCARWNRNTSQEQGFINFVEDLGQVKVCWKLTESIRLVIMNLQTVVGSKAK